MELINLLPKPDANANLTPTNSVHVGSVKNFDGVIALEDDVTEYFTSINSETSITIDTTKLSTDFVRDANQIVFYVTIFSKFDNVVHIEQAYQNKFGLKYGYTKFKFVKVRGIEKWDVYILEEKTKELERLIHTGSDYARDNEKLNDYGRVIVEMNRCDSNSWTLLFAGDTAEIHWNSERSRLQDSEELSMIIHFTSPRLLAYLMWNMNNAYEENYYYPKSIMIYGSNDSEDWRLLGTWNDIAWLSYTAKPVWYFNITTEENTYYCNFKLVFIPHDDVTYVNIPYGIRLYGYRAFEYEPYRWRPIFPYLNNSTETVSGYKIYLANPTDISSNFGNSGNDIRLLSRWGWGEGRQNCTKSDQNKTIDIVYELPTADTFDCIGLCYSDWQNNGIAWFKLLGSNDNSTWVELCQHRYTTNTIQSNEYRYLFVRNTTPYKYYKFSVLQNGIQDALEFAMRQIMLLKKDYGYFENVSSLIPRLATDTQEGYTVASSSATDGDAWRAFDGYVSTFTGGTKGDAYTLTVTFPTDTKINLLTLKAPSDYYSRMPTVFKIQASTDGSIWTDLKSWDLGYNVWGSNTVKQFDFTNSTAYKYYRLYVTECGIESYVRIAELGLSYNFRQYAFDYWNDAQLVPSLSSDSQDGYVVTYSSDYGGFPGYKLFDNVIDGNSRWVARTDDTAPWACIKLPSAQVCNGLSITSGYGGQAPIGFVMQGSNDGTNYTDLLTVTDLTWGAYTTLTYDNLNTAGTAYQYYRFNFTPTSVGWCDMGEIKLLKRTRILMNGDENE